MKKLKVVVTYLSSRRDLLKMGNLDYMKKDSSRMTVKEGRNIWNEETSVFSVASVAI